MKTPEPNQPPPVPDTKLRREEFTVERTFRTAIGYAFVLTVFGFGFTLLADLLHEDGMRALASLTVTFGFGALLALLTVGARLQKLGHIPPPEA